MKIYLQCFLKNTPKCVSILWFSQLQILPNSICKWWEETLNLHILFLSSKFLINFKYFSQPKLVFTFVYVWSFPSEQLFIFYFHRAKKCFRIDRDFWPHILLIIFFRLYVKKSRNYLEYFLKWAKPRWFIILLFIYSFFECQVIGRL